MKFLKESVIAASAARVFEFHEAPDAFARLQPPWQTTEIIVPPSSLAVGTKVVLRTKVGPIWQTIEVEHVEYERGRMFADRTLRGPFKMWMHRHVVTPVDATSCTLTDDITYELPLGALGRLFGSGFARRHRSPLCLPPRGHARRVRDRAVRSYRGFANPRRHALRGREGE